MAYSTQTGFQDAFSPFMEELVYFHDHTLLAIFLVSSLVLYTIIALVTTPLSSTNTVDAQEIELIWTMLPALLLIAIALPSLRILYVMDETYFMSMTVKMIGHQWYWAYEYSDCTSLAFDSYMIPTNDLAPGQFRLLEVDNRMVIPTSTTVRLMATAEDVLHSWALPSLGIKVDAIPGRLSQTSATANYTGVFYGQCSEICGVNHSFMPIAVEAVPSNAFRTWLNSQP